MMKTSLSYWAHLLARVVRAKRMGHSLRTELSELTFQGPKDVIRRKDFSSAVGSVSSFRNLM